MKERIDKELFGSTFRISNTERTSSGFAFPRTLCRPGWSLQARDAIFQIPTAFPGTPPYGFYLSAGLRFNAQVPGNYTAPTSTQPPFGESWELFSWHLPNWRPTATPDPVRGNIRGPRIQSF